MISEKKFKLASGTQVRQEKFGLLFYTMTGPRLYFLPVKNWITPSFFNGQSSIRNRLENLTGQSNVPGRVIEKIESCLEQLKKKGVILEC